MAAMVLIGAGACLIAGSAVVRIFAQSPAEDAAGLHAEQAGQERAPNRREFTITAEDYRFSPSRVEVAQDDLVRLIVQSKDVAYSLTIDEYRLSRRIPAGETATIDFRADRTGTFVFYSNLTSDGRHKAMKGELVVRAR